VSSLPHYVHHLTGGDLPVVQEPLGWERLGRTYSHRILGSTRHRGRQRREILGIRSSVWQRSARSLPPRRRRSVHMMFPLKAQNERPNIRSPVPPLAQVVILLTVLHFTLVHCCYYLNRNKSRHLELFSIGQVLILLLPQILHLILFRLQLLQLVHHFSCVRILCKDLLRQSLELLVPETQSAWLTTQSWLMAFRSPIHRR